MSFYKILYPGAKHDLYDIKLKNWDINKEWRFKGYDLVVCHRTTMYVENLDFFMKQLKKCISKNKYVIFDFTLYSGLLQNYSSTRTPPNLNAKFDFRNLFKSDDSKFPKLQQDYFDATMTNCITEKTLEENNIKPNALINSYNAIKGDVITYMFWEGK